MSNLYLTPQLFACNPQILIKTSHLEEVWRQIGNKILIKTLQKFWSTHIQSNEITLFLEAILFTDEQKSLKKLTDSRAARRHSATQH